jgi:hypothetical protein
MSDLHALHETLNELEIKNKDITHSLENQVTFVRKLDRNIRLNSDAILNLSSILRQEMIQSHDTALQLHRDTA